MLLKNKTHDLLHSGDTAETLSIRAFAQEFILTFNRLILPAQFLHNRLFHLYDCLRSATRTADAVVGLHDQRINAQTVRNHLREVHLNACYSHRGLDLTASCHHN